MRSAFRCVQSCSCRTRTTRPRPRPPHPHDSHFHHKSPSQTHHIPRPRAPITHLPSLIHSSHSFLSHSYHTSPSLAERSRTSRLCGTSSAGRSLCSTGWMIPTSKRKVWRTCCSTRMPLPPSPDLVRPSPVLRQGRRWEHLGRRVPPSVAHFATYVLRSLYLFSFCLPTFLHFSSLCHPIYLPLSCTSSSSLPHLPLFVLSILASPPPTHLDLYVLQPVLPFWHLLRDMPSSSDNKFLPGPALCTVTPTPHIRPSLSILSIFPSFVFTLPFHTLVFAAALFLHLSSAGNASDVSKRQASLWLRQAWNWIRTLREQRRRGRGDAGTADSALATCDLMTCAFYFYNQNSEQLTSRLVELRAGRRLPSRNSFILSPLLRFPLSPLNQHRSFVSRSRGPLRAESGGCMGCY